jgi:hypothetical protein
MSASGMQGMVCRPDLAASKGFAVERVAPAVLTFRFSLLCTFRPLPKTARNFIRQPTAELAREHHNLAAMMSFMRYEISKDMRDIERKIAPDIR